MKMLHTVFEELEVIAYVVTTKNNAEETLWKKIENANLLILCYVEMGWTLLVVIHKKRPDRKNQLQKTQ